MKPATVTHGRHMLGGAVRVFLAEALFPLTGLITAGFLTRRLGVTNYGLLTLTATFITWVEFCVVSLFARGTIKVISEAADWRPLGGVIVKLHLVSSVVVMLLLWVAAGPIATLARSPVLADYLRLYSIDLPLFALATAHRHILVGLGAYRQRAVSGASRWIGRLVLIIVLVELGLSVRGAILANIGASVVELLFARYYVRPSLWGRHAVSTRTLWDYAVPLFLSALVLRLFRLDQFALQVLGGSEEATGYYGAAQNLAFLPSLFAVAVAPVLLSTLTRTLSEGHEQLAKDLSRDVMRLAILTLPGWGIAAGAADGIVQIVFGKNFAGAAAVLSPLFLASIAMALISITTAVLTAAGKPNWTVSLVVPMLPAAIAGHLWLIPRWGAMGAATVTAVCALLGAIGTLVAVFKVWQIAVPTGTLLRSLLLCAVAYGLTVVWPVSGLFLVVKLTLICLVVVGSYLLLGEFNSREIALGRSLVPWPVKVAANE